MASYDAKENYISRYRKAVLDLIELREYLLRLRTEWDRLGYSSVLVDADFTGAHQGMTKSELTSAVSSVEALLNGMGGIASFTDHMTNLYKVKAV